MGKGVERVGVAVVHGIGEQRRFEHIDGQVRLIVGALRARPGAKVTVEILGAQSAAFFAEHDTWSAGPTARLVVNDPLSHKLLHIDFHEVWWGDINEPYSFVKQLRFWRWGLSVWTVPKKMASTLPTASSVRPPAVPRPEWRSIADRVWTRVRLFGVAFVAVIGAASIGILTFLAERVLNLRPPKLIRVFVNYVAGVKLYNQAKRYGAGFPPKPQDFLDTLEQPPRVSVRRRMIRTLMDMALGPLEGQVRQPYVRWYVLAHSMGSVVAFNGLMETAYAWPGYFTEQQWNELCGHGLAGAARTDWQPPQGETSPRRPVWVRSTDIAWRSKVFQRFHGLLTFGSPLEKFATLWPARVPISREPAFRAGTLWLNIYDPLDPVSGVLRAFDGGPPTCCPQPQNIGYAAGPVLLLNHLRYLNGPNNGLSLADGIAEWLITGNHDRITNNGGGRWFLPASSRHGVRTATAWIWWIIAVLVLAVAGGLVLPAAWQVLTDAIAVAGRYVTSWAAPT